MAEDKDDKPERMDISKAETDGDEVRGARAGHAKQISELQAGNRALKAALQNVGDLSAIEQAAKALAPYSAMQEHLASISAAGHFAELAAQQNAMKSLLPDIKSQLSAMSQVDELMSQQRAMKDAISSISALPESWADIYGLSATARLAEEMRERHALYLQPASAFADLYKDVLADVNQSINAVLLPRFGTLEALGLDRIANAFSQVEVFKSLGMASAFDHDIRLATSAISEHVSALSNAGRMAEAVRASMFPADTLRAIEGLLARSLEAQEALLAEHRASEADAKKEASFHRRMATLAAVINILMFLMTVAMQIEDRLSDDDEVIRENTVAIHEMRESFDEMAVQIRRMQEQQARDSEAEQAADAAIVEILGGIADTLRAQSDSETSDETDE